jgi:hypothetical protein
MTTRARASAEEWRGSVRAGASAEAAPSRAGALTGTAADAGRLPPLPAGRWWPAVTWVSGTAVSRSVRDPSNGADDYFAVKDRRLGRSLRSRLRGAKPAPPRLRPPTANPLAPIKLNGALSRPTWASRSRSS